MISDMARVWMISVGLSILAGILPAIQASRLMPIKALRSQ
jgi:ABC-type lipoprotein release transport system permease subunit